MRYKSQRSNPAERLRFIKVFNYVSICPLTSHSYMLFIPQSVTICLF